MMLLWLYLAGSILVVGVFTERQMRKKINGLCQRIDAYTERLEVFTNYNKLAAVRLADAKEQMAKLEADIAKTSEIVKTNRKAIHLLTSRGQQTLYVFDRLEGRKGRLWECEVTCQNPDFGWTGHRRFLLVADSREEAKQRVDDRYSRSTGFEVGEVSERLL